MARTVVAMFDSFAEAQDAVQDLVNNGIPREHVSIVGNDARGEYARTYGTSATGSTTYDEESAAAEGAGAGAVGGTVVGGVLGLLVGIGALAIPGIGPIIAAGPLIAAIGATAAGAGIGAAAGGLLGALVGAGVPEEDAHMYTEGVRRGGTLVTVTTDEDHANNAYKILHRHNAVDVDERGAAYRNEGWERFDPNAEPYNAAAGAGSYPGDSSRSEWSESSKAGTATGTVAGAAAGAAIGSVGGPVGTVVGGVAGAATGAGVGAAGDAAGEATKDATYGEDDTTRRTGTPDYDTTRTATPDYDTTRRADVTGVGDIVGTTGYDRAAARHDADVTDVGTSGIAGTTSGAAGRPLSTGTMGMSTGTTGYDTTGAGPTGYVGGENDTLSRPRVQIYDSDTRTRVNYERTDDIGREVESADSNYAESSKAGTAIGGVSGAATGAAIGAVGGPVGAVVGGVAGAVVGGGVGAAGDAAGEAAKDEARGEDDAVVSDDTVTSGDTVVSDDADDASPGRKGQVSPGETSGV
jgi:hypothetical protein